MPTRNLFSQQSNGLFLIAPRAVISQDGNIFDKSYAPDLKLEDWKDWMRWDGAAAEPESTMLRRKDTFESSIISGASASDAVPFPACATDTIFSYEDAPFELEEPTEPSQFLLNAPVPFDFRRSARGDSTLAAAEEKSPRDKDSLYQMLSQAETASDPRSPMTSISSPSLLSSPKPVKRTHKTKKRKSSIGYDDVLGPLCQSKTRSHNAIEKRYRTNLNDKIACLGQGIPPMWRSPSTDSKSGEEEDSSHDKIDKNIAPPKYGKAAILTRALEYIQYLESATTRLSDDVIVLRTRVGSLERLAISGIMMKSAAVPTANMTPKETLQTIQADFKGVRPKSKAVSRAAPRTKRNSKKAGT